MEGFFLFSLSTKSKAMYIIIFSISVFIFIYYVMKNNGTLFYDENGYWNAARQIRLDGLFNYSNNLRTYLYPFIISIIVLITGENLALSKIIMSLLQYALYAYTIILIARCSYNFTSKKVVYFSILFLGLTNPYLISFCTLFLSDITPACLAAISLMYLTTRDLNNTKNALVISCCLYASVMIRPSAASFMLIFFVIAAYRIIKERDYKNWKFITMGLSSLVIFFPQIYMNITKFNHYTPLIHADLYNFQTTEAVKYLKYASVIIPNENPQLFYISPFINPIGTTMIDLLIKHPIQFIITLTSHIFGLFDWEYVNPLISNLSVKRKLITSMYLFTQWFLIIIGIVIMPKKRGLIFISIIFSVLIYALIMGTVAVESRFGFPIYMFLLFFAGLGASRVIENIKDKKSLIIYGSMFVLYCTFMLLGSYLMDQQTGRIPWL